MKKILFFIFLLGTISLTYTMDTIMLPDAKTLSERFHAADLDYFNEKTKIINQLANQKKALLGVALAVELALYDFSEYIKNPIISMLMNMRKDDILQLLLQDIPGAYEKLQKQLNSGPEESEKKQETSAF